jgi:tetratricopeptide (TPR) repeat protein
MPREDSRVSTTPGRLPRLVASRRYQVAAALAALYVGLIGLVPLFAGPGYELSLASGLVLPSLVAVATALEVVRARPEPWEAFGRGVAGGLLVAAAALGAALLQGLRVGLCDPLGGLILFALGPGIGSVLGGVWGATAASAVSVISSRRRAVWAVGAALIGPVVGVIVSLWRFYSSPMVFAFDPFFGFFSGPLYDTVIEPAGELLTYRLGSLMTLVAAAVLALHVRRTPSSLGLVWIGRPGVVLLGLAAASGSIAHSALGSRMGHFSTRASVLDALRGRVGNGRCSVAFSPVIARRDAALLARDCEEHLEELESFFGTRVSASVTVFLFASDQEKGRLTGAAATQIAKPWRKEIYLVADGFPHPVLGHELAHVAAGAFARGPFRVAGGLGGLLPDPGLIEGAAVAAAPSPNDDLTPEQWARAMQQLGLLPALHDIFGLDFLSKSSSLAYTVAGAFVGWFRNRYGADALRAWYGGAKLESLTGGSGLSSLEQAWRADLGTVTLGPRVLEQARVRFGRPSLFERRCPHVVDRDQAEAGALLSAGDALDAREALERARRFDPVSVSLRLGLAACAMRERNGLRARAVYASIASDARLSALERAAGAEGEADIDLWQDRVTEARRVYEAIEPIVFDPGRLRALAVKSGVTSEISRRAVVRLLLGDRLGEPCSAAIEALMRWSVEEPGSGLADYLLARRAYQDGDWERAGTHLDVALARDLGPELVLREAWRLRMVVAVALEDRAGARRAYAALVADPDVGRAQRRSLARLARLAGL